MARYSSRPRRGNRRPYYKKKHPNRMGQVIVIGVIAVAAVVFFFNRGKPSDDPNTVLEPDINDVVNIMMSGQDEAEPRSVMPLPGSSSGTPSLIKEPNAIVVAPPKVLDMNAGANPEVQALVAQVMALYRSDSTKMVQVRKTLNKALHDMSMSLAQRTLIMDELTQLADIWLFGKTVYSDDPLCDSYLVKTGDRFERIGRNNDVPYQLLMQVNGIKKASNLRAGVPIKVVSGPFRAVVNRSALTMDLYLKDTYVKTYLVGLGRPGRETPTGEWLVGERLVRPPYWDPETGEKFMPTDSEYPIGPYYIKLEGISGEAVGRTGFAIHGTNKPLEIGMNTSSGCIRLRNNMVQEVYGLLAENKSKVEVKP
ncbi:MAG: L,D-transpeptidase family protein [Phycisphaeraceae bacterium]|nr:L,D-transpeptidase family protein [Phycisphaeraceae bacterium]